MSWVINPAWIEAGKHPHWDVPSADWVNAIYRHLFQNSTFLKLLMNPDKQNTVNQLDAANRRITEIQHNLKPGQTVSPDGACESPNTKPKQPLPAAWLHVESSANGWCIFVRSHPMVSNTTRPDFVFNNVFDCARKVVELLQPGEFQEELEAQTIRKLSDALLIQHGNVARLKEDLELMTAGREQDKTEAIERCESYRRQALTEANRRADAEAKYRTAKDALDLMTARRESDAADLRETVETYQARVNGLVETLKQRDLEILALSRKLESAPIAADEIPIREIRVCVEGKIYTIDELRKKLTESSIEITALKKEGVSTIEAQERVITSLFNRIRELESLSSSYAKRLDEFPREWKRGFDAGRDQTMKYVSDFCKEQTERLNQINQS